jgi:hypothetical protein
MFMSRRCQALGICESLQFMSMRHQTRLVICSCLLFGYDTCASLLQMVSVTSLQPTLLATPFQ